MPPKPPAGWQTASPDFVGAGASGSATGWWHAQIERHPDVHRLPSTPREVRWFERFWRDPFTAVDAARYAEWFPRPEGGTAGEWTPAYLTDFWVPEMLAAAAPRARILVLLRDPVERYAASRARAVLPMTRPWDDRDAQGTFQRGLYAEPLRRLLAAYPREQVLILQEEACRKSPETELARTLAFIGLAPTQLAAAVAAPLPAVAAPPPQSTELPEAVHRALVEAYSADLANLAELAPELDLGLWMAAGGESTSPLASPRR